MVKVKYTDHTGCDDWVMEYQTEEEAQKAISEDFRAVEEDLFHGIEHDSGKSRDKLEIWQIDGNAYAEWEMISDSNAHAVVCK